MFDVRVQAVDVGVVAHEDHVEITAVIAMMLPMGPQQVLPVPAGTVRFPMTKEGAQALLKELTEAITQVPDKVKSDLVVAQSLAGVDKAYQQAEAIRQ